MCVCFFSSIVPCVGTVVTEEVICGGGLFPGSVPNPDNLGGPITDLPGPAVASMSRGAQGNTQSNNEGHHKNNTLPAQTFSAGGRTINRQAGDTVCELSGYIAAVGVEVSLCNKPCDNLYDYYQNYLIVYPPCKALFLVAMCKPEW